MATRSGVNSGVRVTGLNEFRRDLRAIGPEWPKELRRVHKDIADRAAIWSKQEASRMGGVQAKAKDAIRGAASTRDARVKVTPGARYRMANTAFWGAKRQTGWYAAPWFRESRGQQHPEWVGSSWDAARAGEGPYAINDALAKHQREIVELYGLMIDRLARRAFPNR